MRPKVITAALSLVFAVSAHADPDKIREAITKNFPGMEVKSVQLAATSGLWEVFNGSDIVYADSNATVFIAGQMIDLTTKRNLTQARLEKLLVTDFAALPTSQAMTIKRGDGTRRVALFADPQCSFCKKLEVELAKLDDITIDVYLTPVLGPTSVDRAKDIACAVNKAQAWDAWMLKNEAPSKASEKCDVSFDKNLALGRSLRIRAVPILVFMDGSRMAGAQPATEIEKRLASSSATQKLATK
ncbi:MAG: DsbC family protein [Betaproteobacteria bacterium]|jgi:thiol:disulfide interchange protein DsbC|nr:DsbC family protein [Betaproteobacteria bacterium]